MPHARIQPALRDKFFVGALFHKRTPIDNENAIRIRDCGQTVRNHKHRLVFAKRRKSSLNQRLVFGVGKRRRLVENHDRGAFQNGTRKRDALTLSPGKVHALFSHHGAHTIGEPGDDVVALGRMERREHLGITRIGAARTLSAKLRLNS